MNRSVFITRPIPEIALQILGKVANQLDINTQDRPLTRAELLRDLPGHDAILCLLTDTIDRQILETLHGCRIIANMAVGYNNIDINAAAELGILVTNTPGVLTECTADLTWALILAVARRVVEGDAEMRAGRFPGWGPLYMLGGDVSGRQLGLVGPGRIAQAVARRALGFNMSIVYHGRQTQPELDALGARHTSLDELLQTSDFVSLHVPLTDQTHHLINEQALNRMKRDAYLINTSRGPVIDEQALVHALKSRRIAGAGLDVYEKEPLMAEELATCSNTVLLPHLGSATRATRAAMAEMAARNICALWEGRTPPNLINQSLVKPGDKAGS